MKLISKSFEKMPGGKARLRARWSDHMRRPALVSVTYGPLERPSDEEQLLMEGDAKQVAETLHALAEIAWETGWRPRGFAGSLAAFAQQYKLPPNQ